jgi:hypothetical protein
MSTSLIRSATCQSSSHPIVLTRLGGPRSRPNPHLKFVEVPGIEPATSRSVDQRGGHYYDYYYYYYYYYTAFKCVHIIFLCPFFYKFIFFLYFVLSSLLPSCNHRAISNLFIPCASPSPFLYPLCTLFWYSVFINSVLNIQTIFPQITDF